MSLQKRLSVKDWNALRRQVEDLQRSVHILEGFTEVLRQQVVELGQVMLIPAGRALGKTK